MSKLGLLVGRLRHPFLEGEPVAFLRPGETLTEMTDSHPAR
jgi:hypothetical protein